MRIVFFGSGAFGLPTIEALKAEFGTCDIVTRPDRPAGRGRGVVATPIKDAASRFDGRPEIFQPENPGEPAFVGEIRRREYDVGVVVAYGHLLGPGLLAATRRGFLNLHASLLPAYRGAAPVPWAILSGETASGATVFALDETFDTGRVLGRVEEPILPTDTSGGYLGRLAPRGARLVVDLLPGWVAGSVEAMPQDNGRASRAPKFRKSDGLLDWSEPFDRLERRVRAFQPWPLAHAVFHTAKGLVRVNVLQLERAGNGPGGAAPGSVLAADASRGLVVMTGDGPARVRRLQPEGKRRMEDVEFLRGTRIT